MDEHAGSLLAEVSVLSYSYIAVMKWFKLANRVRVFSIGWWVEWNCYFLFADDI